MSLAKLPLGQSFFPKLRAGGYLYVDKTKLIADLITGDAQYYFLARPRRFGKSLLLSTIQAVLEREQALFTDLAISQIDYHWHYHAVIKLDFSLLSAQSASNFEISLIDQLKKIADKQQVNLDTSSGILNIVVGNLILALKQKYTRVALLIDEYDRPLLHNLTALKRARELQFVMQDFFACLKAHCDSLDFLLITGVSAFARAGLFSGLNNLQNITLQPEYAAICGYTEADITTYLTPYLAHWAQAQGRRPVEIRTELQTWYNGYHFSAAPVTVYNPFSVTNALATQKCQNFWVATGTPTFLWHALKTEYRKSEYRLLKPEQFIVTGDMLARYEVDEIPLAALMMQAGYLTITQYHSERDSYSLGYPNHEVRQAADNCLLATLTLSDETQTKRIAEQLPVALQQHNLDLAIDLLKQLFAKVPYQLHTKLESFYHSLLKMICDTAGIKNYAEYPTSHGSIDLVLELSQVIYVIEVKFNQTPELALAQIETKQYYVPFMAQYKPIILWGINFKKTPGAFAIDHVHKLLNLD
ncbi:MAG TPA: AAA family ATPase [Candidatus Babeliales bacterium]|nr:AAA family ATPase [Candidatus Babeliales bacterium]